MAPSPNNLLSLGNSTRYGYRTACVAGIGRLLAFAGMIAFRSSQCRTTAAKLIHNCWGKNQQSVLGQFSICANSAVALKSAVVPV
ncbi:UNVERIFIED_ORG: hypothetical protein OKW15_004790 [Pseudomonas reinekei]|nr:hypothetical protein [Pseudomonas reinekei]